VLFCQSRTRRPRDSETSAAPLLLDYPNMEGNTFLSEAPPTIVSEHLSQEKKVPDNVREAQAAPQKVPEQQETPDWEARRKRNREMDRIRGTLADLWEQDDVDAEPEWSSDDLEESDDSSDLVGASPEQIVKWKEEREWRQFVRSQDNEVARRMQNFEQRQHLAVQREVALREETIKHGHCEGHYCCRRCCVETTAAPSSI
jgi:hypothetical protein